MNIIGKLKQNKNKLRNVLTIMHTI